MFDVEFASFSEPYSEPVTRYPISPVTTGFKFGSRAERAFFYKSLDSDTFSYYNTCVANEEITYYLLSIKPGGAVTLAGLFFFALSRIAREL